MNQEACANAFRAHLRNPFFVLEIPTQASREEVERQGARLIAMLKAGIESATQYKTPWGLCVRGQEEVRHALAELRDPMSRLEHEWWADGFSQPRRSTDI